MARNIKSSHIPLKTQLGWIIICLCVLSSHNMGAQLTKTTWDFETGDLRRWRKSDNVFNYQPTLDDNPNAWDRSKSSNHQGKYWIGTFERFHGKPSQKPGDIDTPVNVWVAIKPHTKVQTQTRVPNLVKHNLEEARQILRKYRLQLGQVYEHETEQQPEGTITQQKPPVGTTVTIGTPVNVWVAIKPRTRVPNLVKHNLEEARQILQRYQLQLGRKNERETEEHKVLTIIQQEPKAGTTVTIDTPVNVWVAIKPRVEVPDLVTRSLEEAQQILQKYQLHLGRKNEIETEEHKVLTIIQQEPKAGTTVTIDTPVNVWVAIKPRVEVPDLVTRSLEEARQMIQEAQLQIGQENKIETKQQPEGTITQQEPQAGTTVTIDTPVNVWVAIKPRVEVPDLVTRSLEKARQMIQEAQLQIGQENKIETKEQLEGTIFRQDPNAGTMVPIGTTVNMWVVIKDDKSIIIWIFTIVAVSIFLVSASYLFSKFKKSSAKKKKSQAKDPGIQLKVTKDFGNQCIKQKKSKQKDYDVRLRLNTDPGIQSIITKKPIIKRERRDYE